VAPAEFSKMAVWMTPGSMMATRTPKAATSWASASLAAASACLEAEYRIWFGVATRPAIDVTFTMHPDLRSRIEGRTAWIIRIGPQ
jgi:hypothetical protein